MRIRMTIGSIWRMIFSAAIRVLPRPRSMTIRWISTGWTSNPSLNQSPRRNPRRNPFPKRRIARRLLALRQAFLAMRKTSSDSD
jgi:hypothetical protein